MPGSLDTIVNDLSGGLTKYAGDYGIVPRFLSRVQNGIPGIAILDALVNKIRADGGFAELHGGLTVAVKAQIGKLLGAGVGGSLGDDQITVNANLDLNGSNFGLQASWSDTFQLKIEGNLEFTSEIDIGPGVKLVITVGDMERREGRVVKASFSFALAAGTNLTKTVGAGATLEGGPFAKIIAYDYQWYIENRFNDILYDMVIHDRPWYLVAEKLGLPSGITQEQFAQALFENGSSGDFLVDIGRTAAQFAPGEKSGTVALASNYTNPPNFVQAWYPGIAGYTVPGAYPQGGTTWTRNGDNVAIQKVYYQDLTAKGRAALTAEYALRNNITADPPQVYTARIIEISNVDSNGNVVLDPNGARLVTKIIISNFSTSTAAISNGVSGRDTAGEDQYAAIIVTRYDAAKGRYVTGPVWWDGRTPEQLIQFLSQAASDPTALFKSVVGEDGVESLQVVHRDEDSIATAAPITRIETPGISILQNVIAPVDETADDGSGYSNGEIVVIGQRLPREFRPATAAEFQRNPDGSYVVNYQPSEGAAQQSRTISNPELAEQLDAALRLSGSPQSSGQQVFDHPQLRNAVLLSGNVQVSTTGEVAFVTGQNSTERATTAKFIVVGTNGQVNFRSILIIPNSSSSTKYALYNPDTDILRMDSAGNLVTKNGFPIRDGSKARSGSYGTIEQYQTGPMAGITRIKLDSDKTPLGIQFDDAGRTLGNMLGSLVAGDRRALGSSFWCAGLSSLAAFRLVVSLRRLCAPGI